MAEQRFWDMSLTADEVQCRVHGRYGHILTAQHDRIEERAHRLLPLWREWGLRDSSSGEMTFERASKELKRIKTVLEKRYLGKKVIVATDYNGKSKRSLEVKTLVIEDVGFSHDGPLYVLVDDRSVALRAGEFYVVEKTVPTHKFKEGDTVRGKITGKSYSVISLPEGEDNTYVLQDLAVAGPALGKAPEETLELVAKENSSS